MRLYRQSCPKFIISTTFLHMLTIENAPKEDIKLFQEQQLRENLDYVYRHSTFYKELFDANKIRPENIQSLKDLTKLPTTSKEDLHTRNNDFICVSPERIIDYITTSGTLGDPVTFVLTEKDLERLAYNEYLSFLCTGGSSANIYQLMTTIDRRFMAGLAYFLGARKLGAGIVRVGNGIPELQWDTIKRVSPDTLIVVPSFILKVIEYAEKNNIDYRASSIKNAICIGEPLRSADFSPNLLGQKIKDKWDISLFSTYASTEMGTAFTECKEGRGGHHQPELIIVEFLDENDMPAHPDDYGELTITTLGVEGMPLVRFKTGDVCKPHTEPCACGRNTLRLSPIIGRKKQMIKFKGTSLYPPAIYDILNNIEGINSYVVEVFTSQVGTDDLVVHVDTTIKNQAFEKNIKDTFRAKLRVTPGIVFSNAEEISKLQNADINRKPRYFIDNRESQQIP